MTGETYPAAKDSPPLMKARRKARAIYGSLALFMCFGLYVVFRLMPRIVRHRSPGTSM